MFMIFDIGIDVPLYIKIFFKNFRGKLLSIAVKSTFYGRKLFFRETKIYIVSHILSKIKLNFFFQYPKDYLFFLFIVMVFSPCMCVCERET